MSIHLDNVITHIYKVNTLQTKKKNTIERKTYQWFPVFDKSDYFN